ncbi:MAG: patatin-like phospholipase family protein [Elainellaceae cyanobacterium]
MKKILSIDGGGVRGLIPAMVLAEIEKRTHQPIAESFDLIAGTSTGGILALGLIKANEKGKPEFSAETLSEIYKKEGKRIFPQGTWTSAARHLWRGFGISDEVYSHQGLEMLLKDKFGNTTLGHALTKVLISTYEIVDGEPLFFKSWDDDYQAVKMRDVARATSAAPTYFEPHQIKIIYDQEKYYETHKWKYEKEKYRQIIVEKNIDGKAVIEKTHTLVDGGVFINSPAVSAYAEAKRLFPDDQDLLMVSIGTGQINPEASYEEAKDWGLASWVKPLIKFMFDGVSDAADYQLKYLLGDEPGRYYRLQTDIDEESGAMDLADQENIIRLIDSATDLIRDQDANLDKLCEVLCS